MPQSALRDLRALPKAHLHIHLEGGMRPGTLCQLADLYGEPVPTAHPGGGFSEFEAAYRMASRLLRSPSDIRRLLMELAEDAAAAGAVWIEPSVFVTDARAETCGLESGTGYLEALLDAVALAQHATGVGIGLILAANRTRPVEEATEMAQLSASYANQGVVGFGLMGDESLGPPEPFADAFAVARELGMLSVPHAGELAGPASVVAALDVLSATRIQHGVRAVEDPRLVERLAHDGVCLDVCPTSNAFLSVVPSIEAHPLPALLGAGVRVSINADDPLFFGASLLDEYELCRSRFGLSDVSLAAIAACSIQASGAPEPLKASALAGVQQWLDDAPGPVIG